MLNLIFVISLFIFGWEYAIGYEPKIVDVGFGCDECKKKEEVKPEFKAVLWWVKYYGMKWLPSFLHKPLFTCVMCMSSFYGSILYCGWALYSEQEINTLLLIKWLVIVVAVCGLNRLLKGLCNLF